MASRSSSDSAGEQRLEMGSWNEKKKMSTAGRRGQLRIVEARVESSCTGSCKSVV